MDPFSHLLLGYLLGFGLFGVQGLQYVVAAAVAGALPDADVALFPLSRRFPLLRHRGISHSIVGVTVIATVGTWVVPWALGLAFGVGFASGSPWAYFVALEVGGLSHVLLDAMDHWSVPIFAPFRDREYSFDADRIANVGGMAFTVVAYAALLDERGRAPLWLWQLTSWLLLTAVLAYFAVRLGARWWVEGARRAGGYTSVVPQANPFRFLMYDERSLPTGVLEMRYTLHDLLRGTSSPIRTVEAVVPAPPPGPIVDAADAIRASYSACAPKSWFLEETNRFAVAKAVPGGFDVFWYSLELSFGGRFAGVVAHVDGATGTIATEARWRRPESFAA
jgi:membrane-bound metal-dependent hydrolase YbcI (DUF457 family)